MEARLLPTSTEVGGSFHFQLPRRLVEASMEVDGSRWKLLTWLLAWLLPWLLTWKQMEVNEFPLTLR